MKIIKGIIGYFGNIYESVITISMGMWITFKTAFFERKVTLQYPSHDIIGGGSKDASLPSKKKLKPPFEPPLGASQQIYKGPLNTELSKRYRGLLGYDELKCISCLLCAQECPIDVIRVKGVKIEGRKGKAPTTFRIDYSKCMFCGFCVEVCPTDAVFFTRRFEGATFEYRTLIREFISPELYLERLQLAEVAKRQAIVKKVQRPKSEEKEQ
ncbi:MAG: 4Fe-4S binding protein [Deltaproteobacteria bacterium]|nr:4Fe-4S binding protein [Deltaproteobacteria bacterium]